MLIVRVIIPAGGRGSRLSPITDTRPKGLVSIRGTPILGRTLALLSEAGIADVILVSGYLAEMLESTLMRLSRRPQLTFVRNDMYGDTNSLFGISLSRAWWNDDFCIIDSDVLFTRALLSRLLSCPAGHNWMVIDSTRDPDEIDMRVQLRDQRVWHLDKRIPAASTNGEFFGLSRWSVNGGRALSQAIDRALATGSTNDWYEFAIREVAKTTEIRPLFTDSSQWLEIDTPRDLAFAEAHWE